ncbi:MAG TPA: hypothetical protein VG755_10220 [Nannocystaceae bacterium]|nr:hypothetical protein [Nannocystaceae bacterium]
MIVPLAILVIALVAGPSGAAGATTAPRVHNESPKAKAHVDAVVIAPEITDRAALEDALRLRIGDRPISDAAHARNPREGELFAYVEVTAKGEQLVVRLVLSDARAYVRTIESAADLRAREIAATVANLVAGIEEDDLPPDERDVPLPPVLEPAPPKPPPKPLAPKPLPRPRYELGIAVGGDATLAIGPPAPQGFAAAGGHARVDLRLRSGALVGVALRGAGDRNRGYGLTRIRLAIEGGYAWRRGAFELATTIGATVEPWVVTRGGHVPDVADRKPAHAALGGLVRVAPAWRRVGRRGRAFRLAPFVELAGSAIPAKNGGVARLREQAASGAHDLFRVGGLELTLGLELGAWIPRF